MRPSIRDRVGAGPAYLLHDLEQGNVYDRLDFSQNVGLNPFCQTFLAVFHCPSDLPLPTFVMTGDSAAATLAQGNYTAVNGIKETNPYPGNNTGAFLRNSQFSMADISDGLSNTLFIGEHNMAQSRTTWTGAVPGGSVPAISDPDPIGNAATAQALVLNHGHRSHLPNDPLVTDPDVFHSLHDAGLNFLLGDGSVRVIRSSINGIVYENLLSRADGNPIGDY